MSNKPATKINKQQHQELADTSRSASEGSLNSNSPKSNGELTQEEKPNQPKLSMTNKYIIGSILSIVGLTAIFMPTPQKFEEPQYRFPVYCPTNQVPASRRISYYRADNYNELRLLTSQMVFQDINQTDFYQIYARMNYSQSNTSKPRIYYCGYVRQWKNDSCATANFTCNSPGPLFYVQKNKPIIVAWVNNMMSSIMWQNSTTDTKCYRYNLNDTNISQHCKIYARSQNFDEFTFEDPSNIGLSSASNDPLRQFAIRYDSIPMTTHIHGLEVRPVFDGNPLSWIAEDNTIGAGYYNYSINSQYFSFFNKGNILQKQHAYRLYTSNGVKINRYQNMQPAGSLWYHDHSMHVTEDNVKLGMAGSYIIYDKDVDSKLPGGDYEIFIIAGQDFNQSQQNNHKSTHKSVQINPQTTFRTESNIERNQTYRIRFLNGQFKSNFNNLKFQYKLCDRIGACNQISLNFTIIGSDSCLFEKPIRGNSLNISSAERYELLITFDGNINNQDCSRPNANMSNCQNIIPAEVDTIYLTSQKKLNVDKIIHNKYSLAAVSAKKENNFKRFFGDNIQNITIGTKFYDLTSINNTCDQSSTNLIRCLSTIRMRPIMSLDGSLFFNGHYEFSSSGGSDNPKIGTTEDWYFINVMGVGHPIHIHLINYQIISRSTLKQFNGQCTYYQIDFYIQYLGRSFWQNPATNATYDYNYICSRIKKMTVSDLKRMSPDGKPYLENTTNWVDGKPTQVSGLDVRTKISPGDKDKYRLSQNYTCDEKFKDFKYLCKENPVSDYQKQWKQVAFVNAKQVLQLRIRWTSTDYDDSKSPNNPPYPYFHVDEDQLLEYPGYVYHCHFLDHEDNQLMRPIMMQPSNHYNKTYPPKAQLGNCMLERKLKNEDGWKARYSCINHLMKYQEKTHK